MFTVYHQEPFPENPEIGILDYLKEAQMGVLMFKDHLAN